MANTQEGPARPAADRNPARPASRRSPTQRRREAEVFDTAAQVFLEHGYAGASIQEVADRLGMLKGSLYYYIKTKDDLLYGVIADLYRQMGPSLDLARADGPPLLRLRQFVRLHLELIVSNRAKFAVFYADFRFLKGAQGRRVLEWRNEYEVVLRSLIDQAITAGEIAPSLDVAVFARSWLGLLNSLYLWYRPDGGLSPEQLADTYVAWMLHGVGAAQPSEGPGRGGSASK